MTKMTVLYAVFVALHLPRSSSAGTPAPTRRAGRPSSSAGPRSAASAPLGRGRRRSAGRLAACSGCSRPLADVAGGLPVAGLARLRRLVGGRRAGRHRPHRRGLPALRERPHLRRRSPATAIGALFLVRARGGHLRVVAELALAVRLVTQLRAVVGAPLVGAAAVRRHVRRCSSRRPGAASRAATSAPGMLAARPGTGHRIARGWPTPSRSACGCTRRCCWPGPSRSAVTGPGARRRSAQHRRHARLRRRPGR